MIRRHADLWATAVLAIASTAVFETDLSSSALRIVAGLLLVLVLPGYALSRMLFRERSLGGPERIVISLALSAVVAILGTPLLDATPLSLTRHTWPAMLCAFTVAACLSTAVAGPEKRLRRREWALPRLRDVVLLGAAIAVAAAAIALGRTPLDAPDGVAGYTQLSLTPHRTNLELSVESAELAPRTYRLLVLADGRVLRQWRRIGLDTGERWTVRLPRASWQTSDSVSAYLYRLDRPRSVYRLVRVQTRATPEQP